MARRTSRRRCRPGCRFRSGRLAPFITIGCTRQIRLEIHDFGRIEYDGHPERTADEIEQWAADHDLPYFDDEVHCPDLRVEYQEPDGRWGREDIEVVTPHYRGAHSASVARSSFSTYGASSLRISGSGGGRSGRGGRTPSLADELIR